MDIKKVGKGLAYHLVDTTALNTFGNPIFGSLEVTLYGMSDEVSLNARIFACTIGYFGLGSVLTQGRDLSKKILGITKETKEKIKQFHDAAYLVAFNSVFSPTMYLASGETDLKKIAIGTGINMAVSPFAGIIMGYAVDSFRDLTGLEESERVPKLVKKQRPSVKKGLAAVITAASIGLMVGIYSLTPDKPIDTNYQNTTSQENVDLSHPL